MSKLKPFKWRHYEANIILRCVRWYCTYPLSYRQVAEMVNERGMDVHHTTIYRWVQQYGPELEQLRLRLVPGEIPCPQGVYTLEHQLRSKRVA